MRNIIPKIPMIHESPFWDSVALKYSKNGLQSVQYGCFIGGSVKPATRKE